MKQHSSQAIVLARTNFQEADRIITVLTPELGKVRLMTRGVRRPKSKLAGGIELFCATEITFIQGRGELSTLVSARIQENFGNIVSDVNRTMYGYELLKRINRMTEEIAEPEYYRLLKASLAALNQLGLALETLQFWFELQLLKYMGQQPNLVSDTQGNKLAVGQKYTFSVDDMAFSPASEGLYNDQLIKLLRLALAVDTPVKLKPIKGIGELSPAARQLVQAMSRQYLPGAT